MRGAHGFDGLEDRGQGIIPAYAGSTSCLQSRPLHPWDHPRVCGEHGEALTLFLDLLGSSPRMRGALVLLGFVSQNLGIIPAYAGSTIDGENQRGGRRDHPRVCGEHTKIPAPLRQKAGSSPRMRGAHFEIPDIPMTWYMTGEFFIRFRRAWNCPPTQQGSSNTGLYGVGRPPR